MKKATFVVLAAVLATSISLATPIDTVIMTNTGYGAKDTMKIWGAGHNGLNVYAGVYMFKKTGGSGAGNLLDNGYIGGFCMDLSEYVLSGSRTYNLLNPADGPVPQTVLGGGMGTVKAGYLAELWGRYFDAAWTSGSYTSAQNKQAEAFAAAVWEIIYEDIPTSPMGWDVQTIGSSGGRGFKAENLDYTLANSWLRSLDGSGTMATLAALSYNGSQDFLVAIPEPTTAALITFGLLFAVNKGYKKIAA